MKVSRKFDQNEIETIWISGVDLLKKICIKIQRWSLFYANTKYIPTYRAQTFISLKADLCQDINGGFAFIAGALMEHFLEGSGLLRLW